MEQNGAILVVEDDADVLGMALLVFESLGQAALGATTGREALSILEQRGDVKGVFSDWVLTGGMSGLQLVETIQERWPHIATALTSGYPDRVYSARKHLPDGARFIRKPYRMGELTDLISWVNAR